METPVEPRPKRPVASPLRAAAQRRVTFDPIPLEEPATLSAAIAEAREAYHDLPER